jgi:uncharacterized protein (DUF2384 family)
MTTAKHAVKTQSKSPGLGLYAFKTSTRSGGVQPSVGTFAHRIADAKAFHEYLAIERSGVPAKSFLLTIEKLKLSNARALKIFNIPKSTAAHKISVNGKFVGVEALASIRLVKLLTLAERIVSSSLHPDAKNFDAGKWLGEWIERPQPALGGMKPSDLLDTEVGGQRVIQVLGSLESGSYQ